MIVKTTTTHILELNNDELEHLLAIAQFYCNECTVPGPDMDLADDILCIEHPDF